jgi:hypothetical protein
MSCYEWESGTIRLSTVAFRSVLKAVQDAHTRHEQTLYEKAVMLHGLVHTKSLSDARHALLTYRLSSDDHDRIYDALFTDTVEGTGYTQRVPSPRVRRPKKKDFPKANGAMLAFRVGECGATFERKTRTVKWYVSENNHACDLAAETWLAHALFGALSLVVWTRGTGGDIVGNNEYNRGSDEAGGGGNFVTRSFGPVSKSRRGTFSRVRVSHSIVEPKAVV